MLHLLFPLGLFFQLKANLKVLKKDNFAIGWHFPALTPTEISVLHLVPSAGKKRIISQFRFAF